MVKKFILNIGILLAANLIIKPFWILGIDRTVQNTVGPEAYGLYAILFNAAFIFNILADVGMTYYNSRTVSQKPELLKKLTSSIVIVKLLFSLVYMVCILIYAQLSGYDHLTIKLLLIISVNQLLTSFILFFRSSIGGLQHFKADSLFSISDRLALIVICGYLLWFSPDKANFNIEWFIWAQTVALSLVVLAGFFYVLYYAKGFSFEFDGAMIRKILLFSYPIATLVVLQSMTNKVDTILLEKLLPDGRVQAGIYTASMRLLETTNIFGLLFSVILLPMFSKMIAQKENLIGLIRTSSLLLFIPAVALTVISFFYHQDIFNMLYKSDKIKDASLLMAIHLCAFIPIAQGYIWGTLLTANSNMKFLNIMSAGCLLLNLVLNYFFIQELNVMGAALTALITQLVIAGSEIVYSIKTFGFKFDKKIILRISAFFLCAILVGKGISILEFNWILRAISTGVIIIAISFLFRLFEWKDMVKIILSGLAKKRE